MTGQGTEKPLNIPKAENGKTKKRMDINELRAANIDKVSKEATIKGINHKYDKQASMHINRAPQKTIDSFKEFARVHTNNDYGIALMYLLDLHRDNQVMLQLIDRISNVEDLMIQFAKQLTKDTVTKDILKNVIDDDAQSTVKKRRMLGGNTI